MYFGCAHYKNAQYHNWASQKSWTNADLVFKRENTTKKCILKLERWLIMVLSRTDELPNKVNILTAFATQRQSEKKTQHMKARSSIKAETASWAALWFRFIIYKENSFTIRRWDLVKRNRLDFRGFFFQWTDEAIDKSLWKSHGFCANGWRWWKKNIPLIGTSTFSA